MMGCDHWTGSRYCERPAPFEDEVLELAYCEDHAGPLAWPARDINLYSLAVRLAGHYDIPVMELAHDHLKGAA